jgi:hypothetical protein
MGKGVFEKWLNALGEAWIHRDPAAASNLCSENVIYYEDPFLPPLKGREAVKKIWLDVPTTQKGIKFVYKIITVSEDLGIAEWSASFIRVPSNTKAKLRGIYLVKLNSKGLCAEFHQWWNNKSE